MADIAQVFPQTYKFLQQNFNVSRVDRAGAISAIVDHLRKAHPNRNVVVCHTAHLANLDHGCCKTHMELPTGLWGTTGVDIYIFSHGTFTNLGDGGYINWCFAGNFTRDGSTVTFRPI